MYVFTDKIKPIYPGPILYLLKEKICSPASFPSNPSFQASNKSWVKKSQCSSAVTTKILFFKTRAALRLIYYSVLHTLTIDAGNKNHFCTPGNILFAVLVRKQSFHQRGGWGGESFRWILKPSSWLKEKLHKYAHEHRNCLGIQTGWLSSSGILGSLCNPASNQQLGGLGQ